jgi:hypothetical protein
LPRLEKLSLHNQGNSEEPLAGTAGAGAGGDGGGGRAGSEEGAAALYARKEGGLFLLPLGMLGLKKLKKLSLDGTMLSRDSSSILDFTPSGTRFPCFASTTVQMLTLIQMWPALDGTMLSRASSILDFTPPRASERASERGAGERGGGGEGGCHVRGKEGHGVPGGEGACEGARGTRNRETGEIVLSNGREVVLSERYEGSAQVA